MPVRPIGLVPAVAGVACGLLFMGEARGRDFTNFETAPVRPLDMSPGGQTLAVCNLPDARVDLFDLGSGSPVASGSVAVGLDPVTARFRSDTELWVANSISSSVSVVALPACDVVATIDTPHAPADIVFANGRAFISCAGANRLLVVDPATRQAVTEIPIEGDRPKSMAASPDGSKLYVAVFESGNASTILAPPLGPVEEGPLPGPVDDPSGPYGGINPPPNDGAQFNPPLNGNLAPDELPRVAHLVKKDDAGRWMDDNGQDWSEFVSGSRAHLSGRPQGWDLPDRDLAVVDTADFSVGYVSRLMNICMSVAVNPATGAVGVVGTDATNEIRFEPNLNGIFVRVLLALIDPATLASATSDLNPHLSYASPSVAPAQRQLSLGDPRGLVWSADGQRGYAIGMGSGNLIAIDALGQRLDMPPVDLPDGPAGIVLDGARDQLYVSSRFASSLTVVNTTSHAVTQTLALHDATPDVVRNGRKHLYDTHLSSGLGQASCASCHVDARFDRLAWDLGDPRLDIFTVGDLGFDVDYSPMKGPMVTQTFQDIIRGFAPLHWRGDRPELADFNPTFTDLLGADAPLSDEEMDGFEAFLRTVHFPPNPLRNLDNSLPNDVPLPGHRGRATTAFPNGAPLPNGSAARGFELFEENCISCHNGDAGLDGAGPLRFLERSAELPLKVAQLRSVRDKGRDGHRAHPEPRRVRFPARRQRRFPDLLPARRLRRGVPRPAGRRPVARRHDRLPALLHRLRAEDGPRRRPRQPRCPRGGRAPADAHLGRLPPAARPDP